MSKKKKQLTKSNDKVISGILAYLIASVVMPEADDDNRHRDDDDEVIEGEFKEK